MARPRSLARVVVASVVCAAVVWCGAAAAFYVAMRQPPEVFGAIVARVPPMAMAVLPFKPLWMSARAGRLRVGDMAPDFTLPVLRGDRLVRLSEVYRRQPVVLVFGSYT